MGEEKTEKGRSGVSGKITGEGKVAPNGPPGGRKAHRPRYLRGTGRGDQGENKKRPIPKVYEGPDEKQHDRNCT